MVKSKEEYVNFGIRCLRRIREEAGLTTTQLADEMGISDGTMSNWESGKSCPDIHQLRRIFQLCGKSRAAFLLQLEHPDLYQDPAETNQALHDAVDMLPIEAQGQVLQLLTHENFYGLLQLVVCHMELPLRGRIPSAYMVGILHDQAEVKGSKVALACCPANMPYLRCCTAAGMSAMAEDQDTYTAPEVTDTP